LAKYDIFYERRINYYKNQDKRNVVSIQKLFQLQMAQFNFKPSQARARPKALFNSEYQSIFSSHNKFNVFMVSIKVDFALTKATRSYLKDPNTASSYESGLLAYGRLHMGVFLLHAILGKYHRGSVDMYTDKIVTVLEDETKLKPLFLKALENFKKVIQGFAGEKIESLPVTLTKSDVDVKIAKFVNTRVVGLNIKSKN
jgi:hypothetical protein